MKTVRKHLSTILLSIVFIIGLGLLLYPTVADWWNKNIASHMMMNYDETVNELSHEDYSNILNEAKEFNSNLVFTPGRLSESDAGVYSDLLSVNGLEVMGTIQIPVIDVNLPIYHGTSDTVLQVGAGHLEGTSLPIGGKGTHAVITGHRGLTSAKLFTDLNKVTEGDYIILKVLNETLTYQVDQIRIILPSEVDQIKMDPEKDQITLITCTPYGINSHRLLVTGQRVANLRDWNIAEDAVQIDSKIIAIFIGLFILIALLMFSLIKRVNK